jgi:hypothetical protein
LIVTAFNGRKSTQRQRSLSFFDTNNAGQPKVMNLGK